MAILKYYNNKRQKYEHLGERLSNIVLGYEYIFTKEKYMHLQLTAHHLVL